MVRQRRGIYIAAAAVLAAAVFFAYNRYHADTLHSPVDPADVVAIRAAGDREKAGPLDPATIVAWLNAGTSPRRSPGNVGHVTTTGALTLQLKSGDSIRLWPEGEDFLVAQNGNYYYLKQPDLKLLLQRLDGRG